MQSNEEVFAQLLQAMRARCARKFCRRSPKPARFSLKNRAHFWRATCSTITKIAIINASSRRGSYINPAHVCYSLCVRGAPILHQIQRKITRVSPKKSEIIHANPRGTRAKHAAQTKYQRCYGVIDHKEQRRCLRADFASHAHAVRSKILQKITETRAIFDVSLKNRAHFWRRKCMIPTQELE